MQENLLKSGMGSGFEKVFAEESGSASEAIRIPPHQKHVRSVNRLWRMTGPAWCILQNLDASAAAKYPY